MSIRNETWDAIGDKSFDVVIIGGGINGASIFRRLCNQSYNVCLFDRGDFSCGTSQASAMMIWGGLLYLKNFDFFSVCQFSKDRDRLIDLCPDKITPQMFRYVPNSTWGRNRHFVYSALQLYWLLGKCKRRRPSIQRYFEEMELVRDRNGGHSLIYQEGIFKQSDSRFVLDWILEHHTEDCLALNYCKLQSLSFSKKDKLWFLSLKDRFSGKERRVTARIIINCAGVWTDDVNEQFQIQTPFKHVFSKGVFMGFERPSRHTLPLIFDSGENGASLAYLPWGPVSLWGPTETKTDTIEDGYSIKIADVQYLHKHAEKNLSTTTSNSKIVSLRCGLRPLVVTKSYQSDRFTLEISRRHKIFEDPVLPWISVYGGKISGCISMAEQATRHVTRRVPFRVNGTAPKENRAETIQWAEYPGLSQKVPTLEWCVDNEFCCTIEDYLRRRTNISQWVYREGLGNHNSNLEYLEALALRLPKHENGGNENSLDSYMEKVRERFDSIIERF